MIMRVLKRAKELTLMNIKLDASTALSFFMNNPCSYTNFDSNSLNQFSLLDDYDIMSALKSWQFHDDFVLSRLSKMILNRTLLKIKFKNNSIAESKIDDLKQQIMLNYKLSSKEANYFVFDGTVSNLAYDQKQGGLKILYKNGKVKEVISTSDHLSLKVLSKTVTKHYICFPKDIL
jgi:HD superfamily phosphohydrolase